jgi:hypothetical protein
VTEVSGWKHTLSPQKLGTDDAPPVPWATAIVQW